MHIVVVGGGISGLAAAFHAATALPGASVEVLEQADHIGGKLRLDDIAGHRVDVGAESMLARRPEGIGLLEAVGLAGERISPLTTSATLWISGAARPIPAGTVMGIPTDLAAVERSGTLSPGAQARIAAEDDAGEPRLEQDISVGTLVARRMGHEVVDHLVDPLLGGVYAGRAEQISLRAAVPALAERLATDGGSLLAAARAVAAAGARAHPNGEPAFTSLAGGLGSLPGAVAATRAFTVRTSTAVREIHRTATGFRLDIGPRPDGLSIDADAVIVATPPGKAAGLLRALAPLASADLGAIRSASVAIVTLAYQAGTSLPAGSGMLVPASQGRMVKGITVTTQKWPGRAADVVLLRASLGRVGDEAVLQRPDGDLAALAVRDVADLLGAQVAPIDRLVTRWGGGLPQYAVGHLDAVARIRNAVADVPGLAVAGAAYDGVGIPACIRSGRLAADRVVAHLGGRGQ